MQAKYIKTGAVITSVVITIDVAPKNQVLFCNFIFQKDDDADDDDNHNNDDADDNDVYGDVAASIPISFLFNVFVLSVLNVNVSDEQNLLGNMSCSLQTLHSLDQCDLIGLFSKCFGDNFSHTLSL